MSKDNLIHVLNKRLALYQAEGGLRTSTDSVLLGASCPAKTGESILDLGCGIGSAGLCALTRVNNAALCGLDIQADHIDLAAKNATLNDMADRAHFIPHDICEDAQIGAFNHVICNPPYKSVGAHIPSPSDKKALAMGHLEDGIDIQNWITFAWTHIKGQGSLSIIHEAAQTDTIIHALYSPRGGKRFGNIEIFPIFSKESAPATRVIIRGWKHKKAGTILHRGIIMHEKNGAYTSAADQILKEAKPLF